MSEQAVSVSTDGFESWNDAVRRAQNGETVAVIAHGEHVADVVPSGELERLRETLEILSDTELVRSLREGLAEARSGELVSADQIWADLDARRAAGE